jgi:ankyrin repeat protein
VKFTKYSCSIDGCDFKATRKDNLKQHLRKSHGLQPDKNPRGRPKGRKDNRMHENKQDATYGSQASTKAIEHSVVVSNLFQAAATGNISVLKSAKESGEDLKVVGDDRSTLLHAAARAGQTDIANYLLMLDFPTNEVNERGETALLEAILGQTNSTFALLLNSEDVQNIKADSKSSIMAYISKTDNTELAQTYLRQCTSISKEFHLSESHSMLRHAIKCHSPSLVGILLPDLKAGSSYCSQIIELATRASISRGSTDILKMILDSQPEIVADNATELAYIAAAKGSAEITKLLLGRTDALKLDINRRTLHRHAHTPLQAAAAHGHINVVEILLDPKYCSIDVAFTGKCGKTALHLSVEHGHLEVLKALLKFQGGFYNLKDASIVLDLAIPDQRMPILHELLIQETIKIHCHELFPQAIRIALSNWRWATAKILLDFLVQPSASEHQFAQALELSSDPEGRQTTMNQLLKVYPTLRNDLGVNGESMIHVAVWNEDVPVVSYLLNTHDLIIDREAYNGFTALHYAACTGNLEVLELILAYDLTLVNKPVELWFSPTKLLRSMQDRKRERLFNFRAVYCEQVLKGATAIHLAACLGNVGALKRLLQCPNIDINMLIAEEKRVYFGLVKREMRALDVARQQKHASVVELLLTHGALEAPRT